MLLARRIDVRDIDGVGGSERFPELAGEVSRSRVEVRLKGRDDAPSRKCRSCSSERGANLGRVVRVVVHDFDAVGRPETLEPALDTAKGREARTHVLDLYAERKSARDRGERVQHVMHAGNRQLDFAEHLVVVLDFEDRPAAFGADVYGEEPRIARMQAVSDDLRGARRRKPVCAGIIGTGTMVCAGEAAAERAVDVARSE